jgi:U3 small nucleolar RNA-associated protein 6
MLPTNQDLWREYIKLEIGWVEALRRRWKALGLQAEATPGGLVDVTDRDDEMEGEVQRGLPAPTTEEDELDLGQNAFGSSGEPGRRAIVRGDLVMAVLRSSFSRPGMKESVDWHVSLIRLLRSYPTGLRTALLEVIYDSLAMLPETSAQRVVLTKGLYDRTYRSDERLSRLDEDRGFELDDAEDEVVLEGEELVKELGNVVSAMQGTPDVLSGREVEWNEEVGLWLIKWAGRVQDNEALVSDLFYLKKRNLSDSFSIIS